MFRDRLESVKSALKSKEVRDRLFFSALILVIFRALAAVPVPGINKEDLAQLLEVSGLSDNLAVLSGGLLETASIIAIGIGPYISASIVIQLLSSVIPKLEELRKEGDEGRRKISAYTRYLSLPLAIMQAFVVYSGLRALNLMDPLEGSGLVLLVATLTAGAMIVMWLSELVTESGLGNGSSFIILLGILASVPSVITANLRLSDSFEFLVFMLIIVAIVLAIVFISEADRRIKVMYSRRVRSTGAQDSYIPIKITQFGVMPVIFAVALISFPQLIAQFVIARDAHVKLVEWSYQMIDFLNNPWVQNLGLFLLVVFFSFFYVTVLFNPTEIAENLQKNGGFIPGIRPGKQTADYLRKVSFRLTAVGGLFLGILAVLPTLLVELDIISAQFISGTSLLIAVGVILQMRRQIESMVVIRSYDKYI